MTGDLNVSGASLNGGRVNLHAGQILTVNQPTFNGSTRIDMTGQTIDISNTDFPNGSTVYLNPATPTLNSTGISATGAANFLMNVTYGGAPADQFICTHIVIPTLCNTAPPQP